MTYLISVWTDGGLVTVDLADGTQNLLAFTDIDDSAKFGVAMCRKFAPHRKIATVEIESAPDELRAKLLALVDRPQELAVMNILQPEQPEFAAILDAVLV